MAFGFVYLFILIASSQFFVCILIGLKKTVKKSKVYWIGVKNWPCLVIVYDAGMHVYCKILLFLGTRKESGMTCGTDERIHSLCSRPHFQWISDSFHSSIFIETQKKHTGKYYVCITSNDFFCCVPKSPHGVLFPLFLSCNTY